MPERPPTIFISYSHRDERWREQIEGHLAVLAPAGELDPWSDRRIGAGEDWRQEIDDALRRAVAVVLVISRHFLTSRFILEEEVAETMRRRAQEGLVVFPVISQPCAWQRVEWLATMQCRPRDGKALSAMRPKAKVDQALADLATDIAEALRRPERPETVYRDEPTREVSERLARAIARRRELVLAGRDTAEVDAEIRRYKGDLRSGPQLVAGDFLGGRYELVETIGNGGFATVWKAWDVERQAVVAVKVLHGQHSEDKTRRDRFFRGAKQMAKLNHPGIVRVLDEHAVDDGRHFFVMEYLPGGDLRRAVLEGRLSRDEAVSAVFEVGSALAAAHRRRLIHRDVKPANILLDEQDRPRTHLRRLGRLTLTCLHSPSLTPTSADASGGPEFLRPSASPSARRGSCSRMGSVAHSHRSGLSRLSETHPAGPGFLENLRR